MLHRVINKVKDIFTKEKLLPKDQHGIRIHKHTIIRAMVNNPPKNTTLCEEWTNRLIKNIDMKVMVEPKAYYCNKEGNRGLTCVAIIETSSITMHCWDECKPAIIELDVFSCKDYDINDVVTMLKEFDLVSFDIRCLDRTAGLKEEVIKTEFFITNKKTNETRDDYCYTKNVSLHDVMTTNSELYHFINNNGGVNNFDFVIKKVEIISE